MSRREREIVRRISVLERDPQGAKLQDAEDTINKFFEAYPQGAKWIDRTHESGRENFFAPNLFGGRRHLYGYISASYGVHSAMDPKGRLVKSATSLSTILSNGWTNSRQKPTYH
jgi:hypothetical protein